MKKISTLILFLLLIISGKLSAQQEYVIDYSYDASGNREHRRKIELESKAKEDSTYVSEEDLAKELAEQEKQFDFQSLAGGKIKVFPNPTEGALMVRLENIASVEGINLQLFNMSGHLLKSELLSDEEFLFDMKDFPPGLYVLSVNRLNEKLEYKIIKK